MACGLCCPTLSFSPKGADSPLHGDHPVQTPPVLAIHSGSEFPSAVLPDRPSLHVASSSFFPWEQLFCGSYPVWPKILAVAIRIIFKSELTATAMNCHVFGQEPRLCTTYQLLQGLRVVWKNWGARPGGSWLQKCGSRTENSFFTPKFPTGRCREVWLLLRFHLEWEKSHASSCCACVGRTICTSQPGVSKMQRVLNSSSLFM